jgi:hypothetical protein
MSARLFKFSMGRIERHVIRGCAEKWEDSWEYGSIRLLARLLTKLKRAVIKWSCGSIVIMLHVRPESIYRTRPHATWLYAF